MFALRLKFGDRYPIECPEVSSHAADGLLQSKRVSADGDRSRSWRMIDISLHCVRFTSVPSPKLKRCRSACILQRTHLRLHTRSAEPHFVLKQLTNVGNDWSPGLPPPCEPPFHSLIEAVLKAVAICITMQSMLASNKKKERSAVPRLTSL